MAQTPPVASPSTPHRKLKSVPWFIRCVWPAPDFADLISYPRRSPAHSAHLQTFLPLLSCLPQSCCLGVSAVAILSCWNVLQPQGFHLRVLCPNATWSARLFLALPPPTSSLILLPCFVFYLTYIITFIFFIYIIVNAISM